MARNRRNRDHLRLPLLAGWLFADLFVVLFIIGLASGYVPLNQLHKTPPASPSPSPTPSATPQPLMQRTPDTIDIDVGATELQQLYANASDDGQLLGALKSKASGHGKAGFVLVFLPGTDPHTAQLAAQALFGKLPSQDPPVFGESSGEGLWNGDVNYAEFQIFFTGS
jgi:hypothetical protein